MSFEEDLYRVADSVENLVNHALDSQDFQQLSKNISDTVHTFVSSEQYKTKKRVQINQSYQTRTGQDPLRYSYTRQTVQNVNQQMWPAQRQILERQRYKPLGDKSFGASIQKLGGGFLTGIFGISTIALLPDLTLGFGLGSTVAGIVFSVAMVAVGAALIRRGVKTSKRLKLFKQIKNVIGVREYVDISELTERVNMDRQSLLKELNAMLSDGYFRQGHLDKSNTCLMVTEDVYSQYKILEEQQNQLRQEEAEKERAQRESGLTPEYYEMLSSCESYIEKIHQCNIDLPGEEITKKLNRLETVVQRILNEARKNPKKTSELHKFMDYYMPTTWKLLDAYRTFEQEPIQSENIVNTKHEIEKSLDTINEAYEKLLNDLFQTTAWDISSDISVLNTMLAQEGLTGNTFDKIRTEVNQKSAAKTTAKPQPARKTAAAVQQASQAAVQTAPQAAVQMAPQADTSEESEGFTVTNGQTTLHF